MSRVRGVIASATVSVEGTNPSSSAARIGTGFAPARLADGQREDLLPLALGFRDEVADADRGRGLDGEDALRETGHGTRERGRIEKGSPHRRFDQGRSGIYSVE